MQVGIRELKQKTGELIRLVREESQVILITYHGKVVARISPVENQALAVESEEAWKSMEQLAGEIGAVWPAGVSAVDAVSENRV